eukprot:gene7206-174_t
MCCVGAYYDPNTGTVQDPSLDIDDTGIRATWGNRAQFLLATIGYAVGVGNVWRCTRPMHVQSDLVCMAACPTIAGMPMFLLELAIGQLYRRGSYHAMEVMHRRTIWVAVSAILMSAVVALYYQVIIAWCFYYFFVSFKSPLPWADDARGYWFDTASDYFSSLDQVGSLNLPLAGCLVLAWVISYFCMIKGIHTSGKVVYFTATFPYLVLVILFFRGVTLSGAAEGLKFYLVPDFSKLLNPRVWTAGAVQIFYSLGPGWGSLIAFASYNKKTENIIADTWSISLINSGTSIFAGFAIFSMLGHIASQTCLSPEQTCLPCPDHVPGIGNMTATPFPENMTATPFPTIFPDPATALPTLFQTPTLNATAEMLQHCSVDQVAAEGTGLSFIAYPAGISLLPVSNLFALLFFLMMICLGIDSELAMLEVVVTLLRDLDLPVRIELVSLIVCVVEGLLSLFFVTKGGIWYFQLVDRYATALGLFLVCLVETATVCWIVGDKKFVADLEELSTHRIGRYWIVLWKYVTPILLVILMLSTVITMAIDTHNNAEGWPVGVWIFAWIMALTPVVIIVVGMLLPPRTGNKAVRLEGCDVQSLIANNESPAQHAAESTNQETPYKAFGDDGLDGQLL